VSPITSALYSFNNSVKLQPILIIFGTRNSEVIWLLRVHEIALTP